MDFIKDTFLKLTEYTIPHGYEETLEKYLPSGIKRDSIGNYYIKIGKSETLFTTHLDTYCKKYEKVNHVIDGDIIKTDGTTILGGDNKLGCTILLYMISKGIPGLYYFFLSEEPISKKGGRWGSLSALDEYEDNFSKYKRCIAFDRKQKGSIVTRQLGRRCCSDEFAQAISDEFAKSGLEYKHDHKAYYTDTATFLDTIPECTNLSAGGWNEHYNSEWVDLGYTRQVAEAACKINWESLPVVREVDDVKKVVNYSGFINKSQDVSELVNMLGNKYDQLWTNEKRYRAGVDDYLLFNGWFEDSNTKVKIYGKNITVKVNDVSKTVNSVKALDLFLNDVFGVPFDYGQLGLDKKLNVNIYYDDHEDPLTMHLSEYIKYFSSLNKGNTSYMTEFSKDQFTDYGGEKLTKQQFFKWIEQNIN